MSTLEKLIVHGIAIFIVSCLYFLLASLVGDRLGNKSEKGFLFHLFFIVGLIVLIVYLIFQF